MKCDASIAGNTRRLAWIGNLDKAEPEKDKISVKECLETLKKNGFRISTTENR